MKNVFFILIFCLLANTSFSQKVKYKEVYELVKTKKYSAAFPLLKVVLKNDTSIASANLHLGNILYSRAKAYDFLKTNEAAQIDCDSALFFLIRAKRQINDKETRKNDDYYTAYTRNTKDTLKPITNKDTILKRITADLDYKIKDIPHHKSQIKTIFYLFNKSVDFYAKAGSLYKSINNKYANVKELCMLSDEALEKDIKNIQVAYDSSVYYFDEYKKAIKAYPINEYNQQYEIESIETYRLDGLSKTDFLAAKPKLWNYSKWSKEIALLLDKDIKKMRDGILKYDDLYNSTYDKINNRTITYDSAAAVKSDKKLYSLINKYDYNSMALKLLEYKQKKAELLAGTLSRYNSLENTTGANFEPKTQFFYDLSKKLQQCDSSLAKFERSNFVKESTKYSFYVSKKFADIQGINSFITKEKVFLKDNTELFKKIYIDVMYDYHMKYADSSLYVPYANYHIPLYPGYEYCRSTMKTTTIKEDIKGNIFVAGYIYQPSGISNAFLAKLSDSKQVLWFKNIAIKPENKASNGEFITAIEPSEEGCIVAINSRMPTGIKNFLVRYDKNGTELFNRKVESSAVARQMIFDEINDNFILVTKGELAFDYTEKEEPLTIVCYDNTGAPKWSHKFNLQGNVAEYSKIFEGYLLVCNFSNLSTGSNIIQSKAGAQVSKSNIFILKITTAGVISKFETIASSSPLYALGSVKISNNNINILGVNSEFTDQWHFLKPTRDIDRILSVINSNLQIQK